MSLHTQDALSLEDVRADFESFVSQRNWKDANALLDNLWDLGFKREAIILQTALTAAKMNVNTRFICANLGKGHCDEGHTRYCLDWNKEGEGDLPEHSINVSAGDEQGKNEVW